MTRIKLEEMWAAFTAYQPQADAAGHGASWAKMCREKTSVAAYAAYANAFYADAADEYAAADAADAAYAAAAAAAAEKWEQKAIDRINKVLVKQAPPPQRKPLTDEQRSKMYRAAVLRGDSIMLRSDYELGISDAEAAHGITAATQLKE